MGRPAHLFQGLGQAVEKHEEPLHIRPGCLLLHRFNVGVRELNDLSGIRRDLRDDEVPGVLNDAREKLAHVLSLFQQGIYLVEQA